VLLGNSMVHKQETTVRDYVVKMRIGTVVVITTVMVSSLVGVGVGWEKIQARLRHLDAKTDVYREKFDALEKRVSGNDIQFAEIKKDLTNIETLLLELKQKYVH
jgi:hypothetical protein